jgi:hypothetical protein
MPTEQKFTDEPTEQPSHPSLEKESELSDSSESQDSGEQEVVEQKPEPEPKVWRFDTTITPSAFGHVPHGQKSWTHEERVWPLYDKKKYAESVTFNWGNRVLSKTTPSGASPSPSGNPLPSTQKEQSKPAQPPVKGPPPASPPPKEPPPPAAPEKKEQPQMSQPPVKQPPPASPPPKEPPPPAAPEKKEQPQISQPPVKQPPPASPPPKEPPPAAVADNKEQTSAFFVPTEYLDRAREEENAYHNMRAVQVDLRDDLLDLRAQLEHELASTPASERTVKLQAGIQKIDDRLDEYDKEIAKYEILQIRGPWDVSKEVYKSLADMKEMVAATKTGLGEFRKQYTTFAGDNLKGTELERGKGTLAAWLKSTSVEISQRSTRLNDAVDEHAKAVHAELDKLHKLVLSVGDQAAQLLGRKPLTKEELDAFKERVSSEIKDLLKSDDEKESKLREDFLKKLQDTINAAKPDNEPTEKSLQQLKEQLLPISKGLADANTILEQLQKRPTVDGELLQNILAKVELLETRPDLSPQITKLQESIEVIKSHPEAGEENTTRWKRVSEGLELVKTFDPPTLKEIQSQAEHIATVVGAIKEAIKERPDQDYSEILKILDALVEKVNSREESVAGILDKMDSVLEELKKRPEIDNTAALGDIEASLDAIKNHPAPIDYRPEIAGLYKSIEAKIAQQTLENEAAFKELKTAVDDIRNRPALNHDFATLGGNIQNLVNSLAQHNTMLTSLQTLQDAITKNPVLNINPQDLWNNMDEIKGLIRDNLHANPEEVLGHLRSIQTKSDTIDFPGVFTDLNNIKGGVHKLVNIPYATTDDLHSGFQGVHDNFDLMRKNPNFATGKPFLTHDAFEKTMNPIELRVGKIEDEMATMAERSKSMTALTQNTNNHMEGLRAMKQYDDGPVFAHIDAWGAEHKQDFEKLGEAVDGIQRDDGYAKGQLIELGSNIKKLESQGTQGQANMDALTQKVDGLKKFVVGAGIAAGVGVAFGAFKLIKSLFGKKDEGKKEGVGQAAVNAKKLGKPKKVEKRTHARSWSGADFNGEI